jgi:hypothetical protein
VKKIEHLLYKISILCDASIDVAKFSTLWNEVRVNNNNAPHLNSALGSTVSSTVCSI